MTYTKLKAEISQEVNLDRTCFKLSHNIVAVSSIVKINHKNALTLLHGIA